MSSQDGTLSTTHIINSDTSFKTLTGSVGNLINSSETWMRTAVGTPNTFRSTITVFSSLTDCTYNSCENTREEDTKSGVDSVEANQKCTDEENIAPDPEILFNVAAAPQNTKKQHFKRRKPLRAKKLRHKKYNLSCVKLRNYRKAHVKIKKYVAKKLNAADNNAMHMIAGSMSEISHSRSIKKVLAKVNLLDDNPVVQNIPTEPDAKIMSHSDINTPSTESEINHIIFAENLRSDSECTIKEKKIASTSTSKANLNTTEKSAPLSNILEIESPVRSTSKDLTPKCTPYPPLTLHRSDEHNIIIKHTYTKLTTKTSTDQEFKTDSTDASSFPFTYTDSSGNSTNGDKAWQATITYPCSIKDKHQSESKIIPAELSEADAGSRTFPDIKPAEAKLTLKVNNDETLPLYGNGRSADSIVLSKKASELSFGLEAIKPHEKVSSVEQIIKVVPLITQKSELPLPIDNSLKVTDSEKLAKARSLFQYSSARSSFNSNAKSSDSFIFETDSVPKYPSKADLPKQSPLNISNSAKLLKTATVTKNFIQKPLLIKSSSKPTEQSSIAKDYVNPDVINNKSEVVLMVQDMCESTVLKPPEPLSDHTGKSIDLGDKSFATTSSESDKSHRSFNDYNAAAREQAGEISNYIKQQLVELGMNADSVDANLALKEKANESIYNIEDSSKMVVITNQKQNCSEEFRTVFPTTLTELWDRLIYAIELAVAKAEQSMTEKIIVEVKKLHSNEADKISKALSRTAEGDVPDTSKSTGLTPVQCLQCDIIDGQIIDHMVQIRNKVDAIISDCLPTYSSNSLKMKDLKLNRDVIGGIETPEKVVPRSGEGDVEQQPPESPSFELQHVPRTRYRIIRRVVRFIIENSLVITTVPTLVIFFLLMYSFIAFLIRM